MLMPLAIAHENEFDLGIRNLKLLRGLQDRLDGTAADPFNGKALNLGQLIQQALEDGILQPSMPYNKLFQAAA